MRIIFIQILAFFALFLAVVSNSFAQEECVVGGVKLASCDQEAQAFRSVVLAIPGWTGECDSSFGTGPENLLNAIRGVSFFDVDCFDYEPHNTSFEEIRANLLQRLELLGAAGYTDFALVVHSTGGIIASDLILSQMFSELNQFVPAGEDGITFGSGNIRLQGFYAWAVPFNGLNKAFDFGQWLINFFGASPALLPNMAPGSDFIIKLQSRWKEFSTSIEGMAPLVRGRNQFSWLIMQGQGSDGIVNSVSEKDWWFPESMATLLETGAFHTNAVSAVGSADVPKYPGRVMTLEMVTSLPFTPRYNELFLPSSPNTDNTKAKQLRILQAVIGLSEYYNLFDKISPHISDFLVRILKGNYPHDSELDVNAIVAFAGLIESAVGRQQDTTVVNFGDDLISAMARAFPDDYSFSEILAFGGGKPAAVRQLSGSLEIIFRRVIELIEKNDSLELWLRNSGSRQEFERKYIQVSQRLLKVQDDPTRIVTASALYKSIDFVGQDVLLDTALVESLGDYIKIVGAAQPDIGNLLLRIQQRSPELNQQVLQLILPQELPQEPGKDAIWNQIFTNSQVKELSSIATGFQGNEELRVRLITEMFARGSVDGSSTDLALRALQDVEVLLQEGSESQRLNWLRELNLGLNASKFPTIEQRGIELLQLQFGD